MSRLLVAGIVTAFALSAAPAFAAGGVVTVYSADGLKDGSPSWFGTAFDAFTKRTGIKVQYVEGGSGGVVERVAKEKSNPQADVLVTLPPFIQRAAKDGLLQPYVPAGADQIAAEAKDPGGRYAPLVYNFTNFIYDSSALPTPPKTFEDLLDPKFKNKIQYSTPGQAGDGTAVMLLTFHAFGDKDKGLDYLKKLQENNVGPSASTGKLTALVNKGELYVANGDMQMNFAQMAANPNIRIFWPAAPDGQRWALSLPYDIGLVQGAPDAENGKALIDFLLSKEQQDEVSSVALGLPVRQDVKPTDKNFRQLHDMLSEVKVYTPSWDDVVANLQADVAAWRKATGN